MCDETAEIKPLSKRGDVWHLDQHVVMCGNSTYPNDIELLLGEHKADLVLTDPPYNQNYRGLRQTKKPLQNDFISSYRFRHFLIQSLINCYDYMKDNASLYLFYNEFSSMDFYTALECAGFNVRANFIWIKNHFAISRGRVHKQHEPIIYGYKQGRVDRWYGKRNQSTILNVAKNKKNDLHPSMKPIRLLNIFLELSSLPGDRVLDIFGGSGSTLIACERLGRICHTLEIEPEYVDVMVHRWQKEIGKVAILDSTKETFDEVKERRNWFKEPIHIIRPSYFPVSHYDTGNDAFFKLYA